MPSRINGYALIDSGDNRKLEQFGDLLIDRPSSLCSWRRRQSSTIWDGASALYSIDDHWVCLHRPFTTWTASIHGVNVQLELMSNGQVGLFPEHALYLDELRSALESLKRRRQRVIRVLNLFAYTGLATCFCATLGNIQVTHVDLAKRAIEWAKRNATLNRLTNDSVRWIVDDALAFMAREGRKKSTYDLIIIDPPSFSRVSKTNTWTLDEKAPDIMRLVLDVLDRDAGAIYFTNHSSASTSEIVRNIALDTLGDDTVKVELYPLTLDEEHSARRLPAGSLITLTHGL